MEPNDINNPIWKELVLNNVQINLSYLAGNILLSRLRLNVKYNRGKEDIDKAVKEIFDLYFRSKELPTAKKDIELILKK